MPLTIVELVQRIDASGLMSAESVREFVSNLSAEQQPLDGDGLLQELLRHERLNRFQAAELLAGPSQPLVLGNYVLIEKLGPGGMGLVYKAMHRRMDRVVALKVLSPEAVKTQTLVERFHREVKAVAKLSHPNIVTAFDADEHRGTHFLVMEFVAGRDLSSVVRSHSRLPLADAVDYIAQAACGLEFAHRQGVVHRDIKPANLLLSDEGVVKILDLGLARFDDAIGKTADGLTTSGSVMGTVDYMSPEQAEDTRHADARSDIYSLGCSLFALIVNRIPFPAETVMKRLLAHRETRLPNLTSLRDDVPDELSVLVGRMLAKKPEDRFQTMAEVETALRDVLMQWGVSRPSFERSAAATSSTEWMTGANRSLRVGPTHVAGDAASSGPTVDFVAGTALEENRQTHLDINLDGEGRARGESFVATSGPPSNEATVFKSGPTTFESSPAKRHTGRSVWYIAISSIVLSCAVIAALLMPGLFGLSNATVPSPGTVGTTARGLTKSDEHAAEPGPEQPTVPALEERTVSLLPIVNDTVEGDGVLGDGWRADVNVTGDVLTLDATGRSPQLWLNFQPVRGEDLILRMDLYIDPASIDRQPYQYVKLVFMESPESFFQLARDRGQYRFELVVDATRGPVATLPVDDELVTGSISLEFAVVGERMQCRSNGKLLFEAPRPRRTDGYMSLAASGWRVELHRPRVTIPATETIPVEPMREGFVDLLATTRGDAAFALSNGWLWQETQLRSRREVETNNLALRKIDSMSYSIEAELTLVDGSDAIYFMLPVGGHHCFLAVNAYPEDESALLGFGHVHRKTVRDNLTRCRIRRLNAGSRHRVMVAVGLEGDRASLVASLDGEYKSAFTGPIDALSVPADEYHWPDPSLFGLGTVNSAYVVHSLKLTVLPAPNP
ncbi:MAG: serine/threonine protein kinase [Candidatus Saccharimonas sp.]|nr:serine/threonine protein kinase [Planctomycetaceae bacterium]